MSRQLKFRVWSKVRNDWVHNMMLLACIDGLPFAHFVETDSDKKFVKHHIYNASNLDVVIQQYTGLKDKNGTDIYEGDIVKATSDQFVNENFIGKVIFDEGCFLTWINKNDIRGIWGEDDIEVIGNIFETPKLLEA